MSAAILRTVLWIAFLDGMAVAAIAGFLYTPESNLVMLGMSALLILLAGALLVLSSAAASHALVHGIAPWSSVAVAARRAPLVLVAILVLGLLCGGAGWFESWWMARTGQFDAAAIAAGDVTRTGWVHAGVRWLVVIVQWVLVPAWLATALAWVAGYERRDVLTLKWLAAGLHWTVLGTTALGVCLLVWLPWRFVYWRPRSLPASSVEVVFAGTKLLLIYLLAHVAWTLVMWGAARQVQPAASSAALTPASPSDLPR